MNKRKAELMLVGVTIAWGTSYPLMKGTLEDIAPLNLIALRFGLAFLVCFIVFFRRVFPIDRKTLLTSAVLGILLAAVFAALLFGMLTTRATDAAFLSGIAVVFVPLLNMIVLRRLPAFQVILGIIVTTLGIWLLNGGGSFHLAPGALLCMLCSLLYAVHILLTQHYVQQHSSLQLGIYQLLFTALSAWLLSILTESPVLPHGARQWAVICALGLLCSAFGFVGQTLAQGFVSPERVAFIFTLEPVFTAVLSAIFLHELLRLAGYFGAFLIISGVLLSGKE